MDLDGHNVGTQISFALYSAANRVARMHKPILEPMGLTFPQYLVILELLGKSPLAVGALGSRLDMDTGTISSHSAPQRLNSMFQNAPSG